jgi:glycosyltransferase involved in cell wall biosynthesis
MAARASSQDPTTASNTAGRTKTAGAAKALLFAFVAFLTPILAVEGLLRATHLFGARLSFSEPDPVLGYRYTPHAHFWHHEENDRPITGTINNLGFRDRDRSREKPEGTYRVALLGDSVVEAFQVELDSTFATLAERALSARFGAVELLNFGRSSMTQTEELILLREEVPAFSPDLIAVFFLPINDIADVRRETTSDAMRPFFVVTPAGGLSLDTSFAETRAFRARSALNQLKQDSALISLAMERYNTLRRARGGQPPAQDAIRGALSLFTAQPDPEFAASYRLNKILIEEMAKTCIRQNVRLLLVCVDWIYRTEDIERYRAIDPTFDPDFFENDLREHARALGIEFLGLQTVFRTVYEERGEPLHWGHWNYRGHALAADALTRRISSFLPRRARGARRRAPNKRVGSAPGRHPPRKTPSGDGAASVCMIVQSYCPDDPRVAREAEALAARGTRVDVLCLRDRGQRVSEVVHGVRYLRLPIRRRRGGKARYFFEYAAFFFLGFAASTVLALRRRYDIFQAHNFPDVLVFCGIAHQMRGAKIVLDLHDLMPELFMAKFGLAPTSLPARLLRFQERLSYDFADLAITTSLAFERALLERSRDGKKLCLVHNSPDERLFPEPSAPAPRRVGRFQLIYNGVIAHRSGPDVALRALAIVRPEIPGVRLEFFGSGDTLEDCVRLARELSLEDIVAFHGQIPFADMPPHIAEADLGIIPNRRNPFTSRNFPTRIFEFLRMRKPSVVAKTQGVVDYFDEDGLLYFEPGDERDLARAILEAYRDPEKTRVLLERGLHVYERYRWETEKARYLRLLDDLARGRLVPAATSP